MRLNPAFLWLAVALGVAAAAFLGGRSLRPANEPPFAFDLTAPAYQAATEIAGRSKGGFTGFAEVSGPEGRTIIAGRVRAIAADELLLETVSGPATVRLVSDQLLRRIETIDAGKLRPGVTVLALTGAGGEEVTAVLLLDEP